MVRVVLSLVLSLTLLVGVAGAQSTTPPVQQSVQQSELTLETLFPKYGHFGFAATGISFSYDGRFAAYLHRPYAESYDGPDLWLFEPATGKTIRVTDLKKMSTFQTSARKAKEARSGNPDAANKDVNGWPFRYSGIESFVWSPTAHELLFISEGDIYCWTVGEQSFTRLSETGEAKQSLAYLADGKGYTFRIKSHVLRGTCGTKGSVPINPTLPEGETMGWYSISPDGKRIVVVAYRPKNGKPEKRTLYIPTYRSRFTGFRAEYRELAEDSRTEYVCTFYLHDTTEQKGVENELTKVYEYTFTLLDGFPSPVDWSLDSRRITFAHFEQKTSQVRVVVGEMPKETKSDEERGTVELAKVVYEFQHTGGPCTPEMIKPGFVADGRRIALITELSGYRHLHLIDPSKKTCEAVTSGKYEVYPLAFTKDRKSVYVAATRESPSCKDIYRVDLDSKKMERLTTAKGVYEGATVSPDGKHLLANYVRFGVCEELVHVNLSKGTQVELTNTHTAKGRQLVTVRPEMISYKNRHGDEIHGHLLLPPNHSKADKRPLLIYVYGGPLGTDKNVTEGKYQPLGYFFARYMAEKHGYICVTIDPRGTSGYSAAFEKSNFQQVGKPQVEDLVDGVKYLTANYGVDPKRVGLHGWSFGGFQTQMCLYTQPDVFAVGMSVAGPTEWENYNAGYTTSTVDKSREGQADLRKYSLLPLAKNLKGQLLLVHGMDDDNVLFHDTVQIYRELLRAGKATQVELLIDPTGGHSLGGDISYLTLTKKFEDFLLKHLGNGTRESTSPATKTVSTQS